MAKALKPNGEGAEDDEVIPLNKEARDEIVRTKFDEIYDLEQQIEALTEKHLAPLRKKRLQAWRTLKADTGYLRKVTTVKYAEYKLAREAMDYGEPEDQTIDQLRDVFHALHDVGELDWIDALVPTEEGDAPDDAEETGDPDDKRDFRPNFMKENEKSKQEDAEPAPAE